MIRGAGFPSWRNVTTVGWKTHETERLRRASDEKRQDIHTRTVDNATGIPVRERTMEF
jgi:hypothetical protein